MVSRVRSGVHGWQSARRGSTLLGLMVVLSLAIVSCGGNGSGQVSGGKEVTVPVHVVQGRSGAVMALVPVYIDSQGPYLFALDTGASVTAIDSALVDQLKLPVVGRGAQITGVTGSETVRLVRLANWRAGDVPLPAITATDIPLPQQDVESGLVGLLGSDVLSQYGAITVDYERQVLILRSR